MEKVFYNMKRIDLSVIVPCYNEEKNIPLIVKRFNKVIKKNINAELILVNNGSNDESSEVIKKLSNKYIFLRSIKIKKNIGYGNGIFQGLKQAKGEFICWTHADMQTDLADTIKALEIITKSNNPKKTYVKGKRYGRPITDSFFTFGMSTIETVYLGKFLYDINAQPNLFHNSLLELMKNPPKDFSFDLYMYYLAKKKNYKIIKFPVLFGKRIYGKSAWNDGIRARIKFIKRTILFSIKLKKTITK